MKNMKQVVIVDRKQSGNNFGDLFLSITVEFRIDGEVKETKTFEATAFEGGHSFERNYITSQIKEYAKTNGTKFTGEV